jgi:transposase
MDNAGWHHAGVLHKFDNITLMYLPPYSPELNPQEQVWRQMRELYLANRCYKLMLRTKVRNKCKIMFTNNDFVTSYYDKHV